jgi:glycerol dehydrogenase-like iron-containing ADH family enzyme
VADFQVTFTQLSGKTETKAKYLITLHRKSSQLERTVITPFSNDTGFFEALAKLGISEPQQQRILSVLHQGKTETLTVDAPEDVVQLFGWPVQK